MKKRIFTSVGIVIALALLFVLKAYVTNYFFDAFFAVVACFAAYETSRILNKIGFFGYQSLSVIFPALLVGSNLIGIYYAGQTKDLYWILWTILIDLSLVVFVGLCAFLYGIFTRKSTLNEMKVREIENMSVARFSFKKTLGTIITFLYPTFLFLFMTFINHIGELGLSKFEGLSIDPSIFLLLSALLIPMLTDTFAMLTGSVIGGKKLCPKLSPKKTISGAVGGVLWAVLLTACVYLVFCCAESYKALFEVLPIWAYLLIVFFGSMISQGGDLFESSLKRRANLSDSGNLLPGHGGMLDRIDSYIFIAPYVFLLFMIIAV